MTTESIKEKYEKSYFMPPVVTYDWVKKDSIEKRRSGAAWICVTATRR